MALISPDLLSPRDRLNQAINTRTMDAPPQAAPPSGNYFSEADGPSFDDLLDIINPLQHIPIISMIYRELTGDQISSGARIIGGALYGGPLGLVGGIVDSAVASANGGKDAGAVALALLSGDESAPAAPSETNVASVTAEQLAEMAPAAGPDQRAGSSSLESDPADSANTPPARPAASLARPTAPAATANIPVLSEEQAALLLQSMGLQPKAAAPMSQAGAPQRPAEATNKQAASAAPAALEAPRTTAPAKPRPAAPLAEQSLIEPVGFKALPPPRPSAEPVLAPIRKPLYIKSPRPEATFSQPGRVPQPLQGPSMVHFDGSIQDEAQGAFVMRAMQSALDKYRAGKSLSNGALQSSPNATVDFGG